MTTKAEKREAQRKRDEEMDAQLRRNFFDPEKRTRRKRNVRIGWCITLAIVLVASIVNWGVITGWGNVDIDRITLSGDDGAEFSGLVYRPANATDKTPAPAIIMFHGNAGNARNHESWAMEFARRGFVAIAPDLYGSGDSQGYFSGPTAERQNSAFAKEPLIKEADLFYQYLLSLPYVDTENIICSGHSMGGHPTSALGSKYGAKIIIAASSGKFITEDYDEYEDWVNYDGNMVVLIGDVELGSTEEERYSKVQENALYLLQKHQGFENATEVEPNKTYGSFADGNGFAYVVESQRIHEAAFVDTETVDNLLYYGQEAIGDAVPNYIDANDMVWPIKDYTGLFGIFAWAAFVFATALLLIEEVPAFAAVKRPLARNVGFRGTGLVIASVVGLLAPYLVIKTDAFGIVGGANAWNLTSMGFNLGFSNMGFGVIIGLSIICVLGVLLFLATERKKKGLAPADFGMTPTGYAQLDSRGARAKSVVLMIVKSALVAAIAVAVGFGYTQLQVTVLGTDFYAWFFGVKDLPINKIQYYLPYLGVFILAFVVLSIDMNVIRRLPTTGNETKDLIIAMAVNLVIGITVVIIIVAVKWHLQSIGSPDDTNWLWGMGLDTQRIWGMPVGMTVAVCGSTFIYKKTGNLWLCALLVGTIACIMGVLYGGTRFHYLTYYC